MELHTCIIFEVFTAVKIHAVARLRLHKALSYDKDEALIFLFIIVEGITLKTLNSVITCTDFS
jgi:hypothetical protein